MNETDFLEHFRRTNALLEGHFVLSSGLHSTGYLQCAKALQQPADAAEFGAAIAGHFTGQAVETVVSPAIGGLIIGYEVAKHLGARFIWTEREAGEMTVRRGFTIEPDEKILVVEDVITTGGSTRECIAAVEKLGAKVFGAASIIDRSGGVADVGVPRIALANFNIPAFEPETCELCARGDIAIKPGSRAINVVSGNKEETAK
ncbi:MAG TPA: orotate phosphoribosyltransferase [Pyrinomonadaceae bacterium]|nr:orotate phosphoribosyltransferase [Pyrinomonadaceae bacterium]